MLLRRKSLKNAFSLHELPNYAKHIHCISSSDFKCARFLDILWWRMINVLLFRKNVLCRMKYLILWYHIKQCRQRKGHFRLLWFTIGTIGLNRPVKRVDFIYICQTTAFFPPGELQLVSSLLSGPSSFRKLWYMPSFPQAIQGLINPLKNLFLWDFYWRVF